MTAEIAPQANDFENTPMLSKLALITAGLTIFLALLSLILSNRLETLRGDYRDTIRNSAVTEANTIDGIQGELQSVTAELSTTKQSLEDEKAMTDKLRKKLAVALQESEKVKADLVLAKKTIAELRSTETMESLPASNAPIPDGSPQKASPNPATESQGLSTTPKVQPPVSSPPVQESSDASLPDKTVAPASTPEEQSPPVSPSEEQTTPASTPEEQLPSASPSEEQATPASPPEEQSPPASPTEEQSPTVSPSEEQATPPTSESTLPAPSASLNEQTVSGSSQTP